MKINTCQTQVWEEHLGNHGQNFLGNDWFNSIGLALLPFPPSSRDSNNRLLRMVKAEKKMQKVGVTELAKFHPLGTKLRAEKTQFSPDIAVQCLCAF